MPFVLNRPVHEIEPQKTVTDVGWVSVDRLETDPEHYAVDIVAAKVGTEGAQLWQVQEGLLFRRLKFYDSEGFGTVRALRAIIPAKEGIEPNSSKSDMDFSPGYFCRGYPIMNLDGLLGWGNQMVTRRGAELNKQWFIGGRELIHGLKEALRAKDLGFAYPQLYYGFNIHSHRSISDRLAFDFDETELLGTDALLPDAEMADQTVSEREKLERIAVNLGIWLRNIQIVKDELRFGSNLPVGDVLSEYVRLKVLGAELHGATNALSKELAIAESVKLFGKQTFRVQRGRPNDQAYDEDIVGGLGAPDSPRFDHYVDLVKRQLAKKLEKVAEHRDDVSKSVAMLRDLSAREKGLAPSEEPA